MKEKVLVSLRDLGPVSRVRSAPPLGKGISNQLSDFPSYSGGVRQVASDISAKAPSLYSSKIFTPSILIITSVFVTAVVSYVYNLYKDMNYLKTPKIQYNEADLITREEKISQWFDAFYQNTNEKKTVQSQFEEIFKVLQEVNVENGNGSTKTYFDKTKVILDIGCCSGDLHIRTAQSLNNAITEGHDKINFIGLDKSSKAIAKVKEEYEKAPTLYSNVLLKPHELNFFLNNTFEDNYFNNVLLELGMPPEANLVIASHIAYYAPNVTSFVEAVLAAKNPKNGFAIFIHESDTSIAKCLAEKYKAPINAHTSPQIRAALKSIVNEKGDIKVYHKTTYSTIFLPMGIKEYIGFWENPALVTNDVVANFTLTQDLLEFLPQVPFEILKEKGLSRELISDLKLLARANNNQIVIKSNLEFVTPANFPLTETTLKMYGFYEDGHEHNTQDDYYSILNNNDHALLEL